MIARREEMLEELAEEHPGVKFRILALDLSDPQSFDKLDSLLAEEKPNIRLVINDAGRDCAGLFRNMSEKNIQSVISLNVLGTTLMCHCCLPYMSKGGYQIIVGSEGGYLPLPMRAVYGASKAYGRFLARALREEERERGEAARSG